MTKRRITEAEALYYKERDDVLKGVTSNYVADAPFVFNSRMGVSGMLTRVELFKMALNVPGAIIECGVYKGNSLMLNMHLSTLLEPYAINRSIYGFDTFEGFQSINAVKDPSDISESDFSDTDYLVLQRMIDCNDIVRPVNRIPRCELIKGDIVKTVPEFVKSRPDLIVAMLILDTDLYEPTKVGLENFLPLMPKGGIVALDEVAYRYFPGESEALKEVININNIELKRFPHDSSLGYFRV
jgi:hypothetical protein